MKDESVAIQLECFLIHPSSLVSSFLFNPCAFIAHGYLSDPSSAPEEPQHADGYHHHDCDHDKVAILIVKLRQVVEVHPVETGDKGQGQHDG